MKTGCTEFRVALEQALAGPAARRERLAAHAHVSACASCRAELARELDLERLLARVPDPEPPANLAAGLLARLAPERGGPDELDHALDRLPSPSVPPELAARVLARLAPERARPGARLSWVALATAAAAVLLFVVLLAGRRDSDRIRAELARVALELEAEEELLVYALESWELLHDEDLDVWLASLDPVDEFLLEAGVEDEGLWLDEPAAGGGD